MQIRDPLVHATYYYLREAPGDGDSRRADRHAAFVADAQYFLQSISGWLSMTPPSLPEIPAWDGGAPEDVQPLVRTAELQGRTNASAWLGAYALRNMLLLRVIVARMGEHEQNTWPLLDAALGQPPTTPTWLHRTCYWCGFAPRPPEELEQERLQAIKTPFGVLCLGAVDQPHLLVYPDARTEKRAGTFLKDQAAQLDWFQVQAQYRLETYTDHATKATRHQQRALDQVAQTMQFWQVPANRMHSLAPLQEELSSLERTYTTVLADLTTTRSAAAEVRTLIADYRLMLMRSGLWDAAPSVWESQAAGLSSVYAQIDDDVQYIDNTLRRLELLISTFQTRVALLQSERDRLLLVLVAVLGTALLLVLVVDTNWLRMLLRILVLAVAGGGVYVAWRAMRRRAAP